MKTVILNCSKYLAFQWTGSTLPGECEEFSALGYFESDNGYDLESVDHNFVVEEGRKGKDVRSGDWILKREDGKFTHISNDYFQKFAENIPYIPAGNPESTTANTITNPALYIDREITELRARVKQLEDEAFAQSALMCVHPDSLDVREGHDSVICKVKEERDDLGFKLVEADNIIRDLVGSPDDLSIGYGESIGRANIYLKGRGYKTIIDQEVE
jgi:hypothetical protein